MAHLGGPAEVVATFAPGTTYRWSLLGGALGVLALLVLLLVGRRRRAGTELPAVAERSLPPLVPLVLAPVLGALLAGVAGAWSPWWRPWSCGLVRRVHAGAARGLVGALVLPAVGVYAFLPWGGLDGWAASLAWPSYLVVAVVSGLLVLLDADPRRREPALEAQRRQLHHPVEHLGGDQADSTRVSAQICSPGR